MATAVLYPSLQKFPVGTTVGAYAERGNMRLAEEGKNDAPNTASVTTADVASDGSLTFTGLADDTQYIAAAQVSSVWHRTNFHTPVASATLLARRPSWKVRRQAAGLS